MAKQFKIGFIHATNEIDVQWYRPLAFGYLKSYLEKYLPNNVDIDMQFLDTLEDINKVDILAISSTSQDFNIAKKIAESAKECNKRIITILGGHHITYLPETLTKEFDIGVMGEGEQIFLDLVLYFVDNGLRLKIDILKNIKGIVFRDNGNTVITPVRELIEPLDRIPFPSRSKDSAPYFFTSRGCSYKCAFCSSSAFWKKIRFFSAEYVVSEIEHVLKQFPDLKHISIWDDLFIVNKARFKKFVELVEEKEINKRVTFAFSVRANLIDDELCKLLKRINVTGVSFGAESGSDKILELLNKGATVKINQKAIDTLHEYMIAVGCSFIIGSPTETENDARRTYEFILKNITDGKLNPDCHVNILMPMPGTEMWNYAIRSGIIDVNNFDWRRLSVFASYRDSNIKDFSEWVEHRRKNNSIYLAEDTLLQEQLYEIMYIYESIFKTFERNRELEEKEAILNSILKSKTWRFMSPINRAFNLLRRELRCLNILGKKST
jgi:radical SAM superfamily enzyme YgiQ (UPF0313 family)